MAFVQPSHNIAQYKDPRYPNLQPAAPQPQVPGAPPAPVPTPVKTAVAPRTNPDGSPIRPQFASVLDKHNSLMPQFQLSAQPSVQVDQRAMNAIRDRGLSQGPSPWANMMNDRQRIEQDNQLYQAGQQALKAQSQAQTNLAMRGGVSRGAAERMAKQGMKDQLMAIQNVNRQGQVDRMNIGLQDEQQKMDLLKQASGLDFQNANLGLQNRAYGTDVARFNMQNAIGGMDKRNDFNAGVYRDDRQAWAANEQARIMAGMGQGKQGGMFDGLGQSLGLSPGATNIAKWTNPVSAIGSALGF